MVRFHVRKYLFISSKLGKGLIEYVCMYVRMYVRMWNSEDHRPFILRIVRTFEGVRSIKESQRIALVKNHQQC